MYICLQINRRIDYGSRPNTLETKKFFFETKIDPICEVDKIYRVGVEIAPLFKKYRSQSVDYAGIPETSSVRKYQNHEC